MRNRVTEEEANQRDLNVGATRIGLYLGSRTKVEYVCKICKKPWLVFPHDVWKGKEGHLRCAIKKHNDENDNNYINKTINNIFIKSKTEKRNYKNIVYNCICHCGKNFESTIASINMKHTTSCGCIKEENLLNLNRKRWVGVGQLSNNYYLRLKNSAYKRNIEFNIDINYLWNLFEKQNETCNLSSLKISLIGRDRHLKGKEQTASVDRIDNSKGYIEGNVQWVHKEINRMKGSLNQNEFIEFCKIIATHNQEKHAN